MSSRAMRRAGIQTFLAVARLKSFRRAADFLNTTQSNVSARVATLERDLGVALFDRAGGQVRLTSVGRDLVPRAEAIQASFAAFEAAAGVAGHEAGVLRLALSETMVSVLLPRFMADFTRRFPKASVEITVDATANQRALLLAGEVDVALLMGPVSAADVTNLPLMALPMAWVVDAAHPAAGRRIAATELRRWPIMGFARNSRPYAELRAALAAAGVERPRLFASNALEATLRLLRALHGVATLPEAFVRPELARGALARVDVDVPLADLTFTASFLTEGGGGLAAEAAAIAHAAARKIGG